MTTFKRYDPYAKRRAAASRVQQQNKSQGPKIWSQFQQAIFDDVKRGTGHTIVMARAGSGKTTVLEECARIVPNYKKVLMCAFNASIKDELLSRIALPNVDISTLHGFGMKMIKRAFPSASLDKYKAKNIAEAKVPNPDQNQELVANLIKAVSLCKGYIAENVNEIDEVLDKHGVEFGKEISRDNFISKVQECLHDHLNTYRLTGRIDYDDMIWLPVKLELNIEKYDMVFIDETQDLNLCQIYLALSAVDKNSGRIIAVGDDRQAIYGFRGASSDAVEVVRTTLNAKVLPLSITYRCAKKIVELAQSIVPDFQAADSADDGSLYEVNTDEMISSVKGGDFILSRKNSVLMNLCMQFLKQGRRANIQGKDFGKNLIWTINRSGCENVQDFLNYIEDWGEAECNRLALKKRDSTYITDKVECFQILCEGAKTLKQVVDRINEVFSDQTGDSIIVLSSVHKAKGLERDRVFMMGKTFNPGKNTEEDNLFYVAVTRARKELYMVFD